MKNIIIISISTFALIYLLFSFGAVEIDFRKWTTDIRVLYLLASVGLSLILIVIKNDSNNLKT